MKTETVDTHAQRAMYIGSQLARLQVYYGIEIPAERIEIYVEELNHLTPDQIDAAVKRIKQTWKPSGANPYPPIPAFLEACGQSPDDGAQLAIAAIRTAIRRVGMYNSVSFCDPALHYVIEAYGGWNVICTWGQKEWDINDGRMREAYREARLANYDGGNHCAGIFELDGNGSGEVRYIDLRDKGVRGKISFENGELDDAAIAQLDSLCYPAAEAGQKLLINETITLLREAV